MPIKHHSNHHKGFTLLEVMISVFILGVGLLGLAGLQVTSLKSNHSAQLRTEAIIHIYDIVERMRINKAVAQTGGYDIDLGDAAPATSSIVDTDRAAWKAALSSALPNGDGAIATDGNDITTITIQWDDSRGAGGSSTQQFSISSEL